MCLPWKWGIIHRYLSESPILSSWETQRCLQFSTHHSNLLCTDIFLGHATIATGQIWPMRQMFQEIGSSPKSTSGGEASGKHSSWWLSLELLLYTRMKDLSIVSAVKLPCLLYQAPIWSLNFVRNFWALFLGQLSSFPNNAVAWALRVSGKIFDLSQLSSHFFPEFVPPCPEFGINLFTAFHLPLFVFLVWPCHHQEFNDMNLYFSTMSVISLLYTFHVLLREPD